MGNINSEYVEELNDSWLNMFKKSTLIYLVLDSISKKDNWSEEILNRIARVTKWDISPKSIYRTLNRLEKQGLITHELAEGHKTGAKKKLFVLTPEGEAVLGFIKNEIAKLQSLEAA